MHGTNKNMKKESIVAAIPGPKMNLKFAFIEHIFYANQIIGITAVIVTGMTPGPSRIKRALYAKCSK